MSVEINAIPHHVLTRLGARRAVLMTDAHLGERVLASTSMRPTELHEVQDLDPLWQLREKEGVFSITLTVLRLDRELIEECTEFIDNRYRIMSELDTLYQYQRDVYVVYAITHYNPDQRPFGPLTVNIGGDCYRTGNSIKDLSSILVRTRDLANAMIKKSVMIFPDIPALHGGKKGEWIILDRKGEKLYGLSEEAIIALGSAIIPRGISFLNLYKEERARQLGIFADFPEQGYIQPDTASPDVLSGVYWRGERKDKYINMCDAWHRRGENMSQVTCLPANLGGTADPSARPTGYGVATTTVELAKAYFEPRGKSLQEVRFLLEAAGGVGRNTVESLIQVHGVPPENITVFDVHEPAATFVAEKFRVRGIPLRTSDFYHVRLLDEIRRGAGFDVWINNGEGDNTRPQEVQHLLDAGVRLFTGGANNILHLRTRDQSMKAIFDADGWIWPDEATSGGGWTLAVIGILTRSQGAQANTEEIRERILQIINTRNARLVQAVLEGLPAQPSGQQLWTEVNRLIEERVQRTLAMNPSPEEVFAGADTRNWDLS
ncbi:MAG: hypothetical protein AAGD01_09760 [Acidobacteriota bacterium]